MLLPSSYRFGNRIQVGANLAVAAVVLVLLLVVLSYLGMPPKGLLLMGVLFLALEGGLAVGLWRRLEKLGRKGQGWRAAGLERRRREQAGRQRLAATVLESTSEGVMVVDENGVIASVNPAFTEITGYTAAEVIGRTPALLRSDVHDSSYYQAILESLLAHGRWQGELWSRRKDGEVFPEWLTINLLPETDGVAASYVALFVDITEQRQKDERIRHLAFHDPLTGLPNRSLLFDRLQHALQKAKREQHGVAVLFVDLDRFKSVNDSLGHEVGDLLLQELGKRLSSCLRGTDTVARLGGDEFVVLLEALDAPEHAANVAANLISVISLPQDIAGHSVQVGASVGIALYPEDSGSAVDLMKHADTAMYAAKLAGKGTFRFFHSAMTAQASARLQLESDLRKAAERDELELHFQPETGLADQRPRRVEALVRWRHPERGLLLPGEFLQVAEEIGAMGAIGDWVLEAVCRQQAAWQRLGLDLPIAVNISASQLQGDMLPGRLQAMVQAYGLQPGNLQLELSEGALMADPARYCETLGQLRDMGFRVALDDFGTGGSSLACLGLLPFDVLKVAPSFVIKAPVDEMAGRVVRSAIALAQSLQMAVVAEGVETEAQAEWLREAGCPEGQGFFFAPPGSAAAIEGWLATRLLS